MVEIFDNKFEYAYDAYDEKTIIRYPKDKVTYAEIYRGNGKWDRFNPFETVTDLSVPNIFSDNLRSITDQKELDKYINF